MGEGAKADTIVRVIYKLRFSGCNVNRRKKGNQILKARAKKAKARLAPKNKTPYINKAERARIENSEKTNAEQDTAAAPPSPPASPRE